MIPALIGAAGALGAAALSTSSQNDTNRQNYQIFREQMANDWRKFAAEKHFNSIDYQVRSMRRAGINPALNPSMSHSVSAGGSPSANPMQALDYSGYVQGASSLMNSLYTGSLQEKQGAKVESETIGQDIDNQTKGLRNLYEIKNLVEQGKNLGWNNKYMEQLARSYTLQNEYLSRSLGDRLEQQSWQTEMSRAQAESQLIANRYAARKHEADLKLLVAQEFANYASGRASLKEAHTNMMKAYAMYGKSDAERNEFFHATLDGLIQARNTSESQEYRNFVDSRPVSVGLSNVGGAPPAAIKRASRVVHRH